MRVTVAGRPPIFFIASGIGALLLGLALLTLGPVWTTGVPYWTAAIALIGLFAASVMGALLVGLLFAVLFAADYLMIVLANSLLAPSYQIQHLGDGLQPLVLIAPLSALLALRVLETFSKGRLYIPRSTWPNDEVMVLASVAIGATAAMGGLLTFYDQSFMGFWFLMTIAAFATAGLFGAWPWAVFRRAGAGEHLVTTYRARRHKAAGLFERLTGRTLPYVALGTLLVTVILSMVLLVVVRSGGTEEHLQRGYVVGLFSVGGILVGLGTRSWRVGLAGLGVLWLGLNLGQGLAMLFGPSFTVDRWVPVLTTISAVFVPLATALFARYKHHRKAGDPLNDALLRSIEERSGMVLIGYGAAVVVVLPGFFAGMVALVPTLMALILLAVFAVLTLFALPGILILIDLVVPRMHSVQIDSDEPINLAMGRHRDRE